MPYQITFKKDGKRKTVYVLSAVDAIEAISKASLKLEGATEILSVKIIQTES